MGLNAFNSQRNGFEEYFMGLNASNSQRNGFEEYFMGLNASNSQRNGFEEYFMGLNAFNSQRNGFEEYFMGLNASNSQRNGFEEYFMGLNASNSQRNPWFDEYFTHCRLTQNHTDLNRSKVFELDDKLQFVSDAVLVFAHALKNMHADKCGMSYEGVCEAMDFFNGQVLRDYMLNVSFVGLSNLSFRFAHNGEGPARYRVLNFARSPATGELRWTAVGIYENDVLTVNSAKLRFVRGDPERPESLCSRPESLCSRPESLCSRPCADNESRHQIDGDPCCWKCIPCTEFQYLPTPTGCEYCDLGTQPSTNLSVCVPIPEHYLSYRHTIGIVIMAAAGLGVLLTIYTIVMFVRYRDTPVVKAAGRELSLVLLSGILSCYFVIYLVVCARPSRLTCAIQQIGTGFTFSVCYSALLVKTNRIARIFRAGRRTVQRPRCVSPSSQLALTAVIISGQLVFGLISLIASPPDAVHFHPTRSENQLVCSAALGLSNIFLLLYPNVLVVLCTVHAVMTRNIPEAFNESRHIGLTMYTTCVIWAAFIPIYISTRNDISFRMTTVCFVVIFNATVCLFCLFAPKIYVIVHHPERNVRKPLTSRQKNESSTGVTAQQEAMLLYNEKHQEAKEFEEMHTLSNIEFGTSLPTPAATRQAVQLPTASVGTQTENESSLSLHHDCSRTMSNGLVSES